MKISVYETTDGRGITYKVIEVDEDLSKFLKTLTDYLELRCLEMAG